MSAPPKPLREPPRSPGWFWFFGELCECTREATVYPIPVYVTPDTRNGAGLRVILWSNVLGRVVPLDGMSGQWWHMAAPVAPSPADTLIGPLPYG